MNVLKIICASFFILFFTFESTYSQGDTLYVNGRFLYTSANEKVILRGVNEMFVWNSDKTGDQLLPEISQSGSNSVRLVWTHQYGRPDQLIELIENSIGYKMIAIPECHDATGEWDEELQACIDFWNDPVLIEGIQRNRKWTILNIANEAGNGSISDQMFLEMYKDAITSLRSWGYTVPIMIDASIWGQNIDQIGRTAVEILNHDPLRNVIFSTHSYWDRNSTIDNYQKVVDLSEDLQVCIIVGEGPSITRFGDCEDPNPLPYLDGMQILQEGESGWLNWSWGGQQNGDCDEYRYFDFTVNGEFANWQTIPGGMVVANDENSIMRTSQRPESFYENGNIDVSGVYLFAPSDTVAVGGQLIFEPLIAPVNATNKSYSISHDDTDGLIFFDHETNTVQGLEEGSITFTLTSNDGNWIHQRKIVVYGRVTGIDNLENQFSIAPNPVLNKDLVIRMELEQSGILHLFSVTGKRLYSKKFEFSDSVQVENEQIPNGTFILQISTDKGRKVVKMYGK